MRPFGRVSGYEALRPTNSPLQRAAPVGPGILFCTAAAADMPADKPPFTNKSLGGSLFIRFSCP
jgi:hypothetical protein